MRQKAVILANRAISIIGTARAHSELHAPHTIAPIAVTTTRSGRCMKPTLTSRPNPSPLALT